MVGGAGDFCSHPSAEARTDGAPAKGVEAKGAKLAKFRDVERMRGLGIFCQARGRIGWGLRLTVGG